MFCNQIKFLSVKVFYEEHPTHFNPLKTAHIYGFYTDFQGVLSNNWVHFLTFSLTIHVIMQKPINLSLGFHNY